MAQGFVDCSALAEGDGATPYSAAVVRGLTGCATKARAAQQQRYFKTGEGEYGEGDVFLGASMPQTRQVARDTWPLLRALDEPLDGLRRLMVCRQHEVRMVALLGFAKLMDEARKNDARDRMAAISAAYIACLPGINNWDLVDNSAPLVTGAYLFHRAKKDASFDAAEVLDGWAAADSVWLQRIAVLSTFPFVRAGLHAHTLRLAQALLDSPHDLIRKAVGWLLREVGKRDEPLLLRFLHEHERYRVMPRVMLRYAIERLPPQTRHLILHGMPFPVEKE